MTTDYISILAHVESQTEIWYWNSISVPYQYPLYHKYMLMKILDYFMKQKKWDEARTDHNSD